MLWIEKKIIVIIYLLQHDFTFCLKQLTMLEQLNGRLKRLNMAKFSAAVLVSHQTSRLISACFCPLQLNSDSATDDATSNHVDSLQQSQESSSSALTEEAAVLPSLPSLPRLDSPILEMAHSDSTSSQLPEVRSIGSNNKLWCSGAF